MITEEHIVVGPTDDDDDNDEGNNNNKDKGNNKKNVGDTNIPYPHANYLLHFVLSCWTEIDIIITIVVAMLIGEETARSCCC